MPFKRQYKLNISNPIPRIIDPLSLDNTLLYPVAENFSVNVTDDVGLVGSQFIDPNKEANITLTDNPVIDNIVDRNVSPVKVFDEPLFQRIQNDNEIIKNTPSFEITDHRITFRILKEDKKPNTATFSIFNPPDEFSNLLGNSSNINKLALVFDAKYEDDEDYSRFFLGNITYFEEIFEGQDKILKIEAITSAVTKKDTRSYRVFETGTSVKEIVDTLVDDLNLRSSLKRGESKDSKDSAKFKYPFFGTPNEKLKFPLAISGNTFTALQDFCERSNYVLTIDDDELMCYPDNSLKGAVDLTLDIAATGGQEAFSDEEKLKQKAAGVSSFINNNPQRSVGLSAFSPEGILVGRPSFIANKGHTYQSQKQSNHRQIRFKTLLQPFRLFDTVVVKAGSGQEDFKVKVTKVEHKGDTEGNSYYSEVIGDLAPLRIQ